MVTYKVQDSPQKLAVILEHATAYGIDVTNIDTVDDGYLVTMVDRFIQDEYGPLELMEV